MTPNGLWLITVCQCRLMDGNKCTFLVGDVDSGEGYICVRERGIGKIFISSSQFSCESKTALKNKVYIFKSKKKFRSVMLGPTKKSAITIKHRFLIL